MSNWQERIKEYRQRDESEANRKAENERKALEKQQRVTSIKHQEYSNNIKNPEFEILDYLNTEQKLISFNEEILGNNGTITNTKSKPYGHAEYTLSLTYLSKGSSLESIGCGDDPNTYSSYISRNQTSISFSLEIQPFDKYPRCRRLKINHTVPEGLPLPFYFRPAYFDYSICFNDEPKFQDNRFYYRIQRESLERLLIDESNPDLIPTDFLDNSEVVSSKESPGKKNEDTFYFKMDNWLEELIERYLIKFNDEIIKKHEIDSDVIRLIKSGKSLPGDWEKCIERDQVVRILDQIKLDREKQKQTSSKEKSKRSFLDRLLGK